MPQLISVILEFGLKLGYTIEAKGMGTDMARRSMAAHPGRRTKWGRQAGDQGRQGQTSGDNRLAHVERAGLPGWG